MISISGCTQPVASPAPTQSGEIVSSAMVTNMLPVPAGTTGKGKAVAATVTKPDSTRIVISYVGGRDADQLMERKTTLTDSKGTVRT